ncbi:MAG: biosynthetic-type acetolactate synthase large subunit [Firmicutes bacterium]|nr:biosynthetic-type acetolactate synthase large subunit [Bacillota bacterium]
MAQIETRKQRKPSSGGAEPVRMLAAEALIESLRREGVEVIFGYPGGSVLPIYDVLYHRKDIFHVLVRHEQGAAHSADGYARATGKAGVCMATSGPGATNLVTGIANAHMDSIPVVAITGQVPVPMIGKDSFQEANITGITVPITKHNYLVQDPASLPGVVREAFHIATTGRPGPVLIDIPKDVASAMIDYVPADDVDLPGYKPTYTGHTRQIREAARAIQEAKRPVLYIGGGVMTAGAQMEVLELAERCSLPVTMTLMGLGGFPGDHPLSLGMPGMHGTAYANLAMTECDLLVGVGARFDDRVTGKLSEFAKGAKVIHIDIDPAEIGKNVRVDIPIVGDAKLVLKELLGCVKPAREEAWLKKIDGWKEAYPLRYADDSSSIKPQYVLEQIYELTGGEAVITTEVGQNQMWAAQYWRARKPRSFISSGGLGTMGFGFPAAIGAQVGRPGELVIDIAGDGSFQMNIQELATAASYNLPVKVAILNNRYLGMVRQWQELFYEGRYSNVCLACCNPDFVKIASGYGVLGFSTAKKEEVRGVLEKALSHDGPVVMDFRVARGENVFPMVPAGGSISEMLGMGGPSEG